MKVVWSELAKITLSDEVGFIYKKWNQNEVEKFLALVDDFINSLNEGIYSGIEYKGTKYLYRIISKQTTVYFKIDRELDIIEINLFWNNTQNPETLKQLLKA